MLAALAEATSDDQLHDLFGANGTVVRVHVVQHRHSEKPAGYGFVEMELGEQARGAVSALGKALFGGNCLRLCVTPYASIRS